MARKQRVQVDSGISPERLRPAAAPVDRFTRPREGQKLAQLADALARFEPSLRRFSAQKVERDAKEGLAEGQREAQKLIESQVEFNQAVKDGLIDRHQNPWFRLGMKRQFASVAADEYDRFLSQRTGEWLRAGRSPEDFDALEAEARKEWVEEHVGEANRDPMFDGTFAEKVNQSVARTGSAFVRAAGQEAVNLSLQMLGQEVSSTLANTDPSQWGEALTQLGNEAVTEMTLPGREVNTAIADAVIQEALDRGDLDMLGARIGEDGMLTLEDEGTLFDVQGGSGPLGGITEVKDKRRAAAKQILQQQEIGWAREEKIRERQADELMRGNVQAILDAEDLWELDWDAMARDVAEHDWRLASQFRTLRSTMGQQEIESDPALVDGLRASVLMGRAGLGSIIEAYNSGDINGADMQALVGSLSTIQNYQRSVATTGVDPLKEDYWQDAERFIEKLGSDDLTGNLTGTSAAKAWRVTSEARDRWLEYWYKGGGAEASPEDRRDTLDRILEQVRRDHFPAFDRVEGQDPLAITPRERDILQRALSGEAVTFPPALNDKLYRHQATQPQDWINLLKTGGKTPN